MKAKKVTIGIPAGKKAEWKEIEGIMVLTLEDEEKRPVTERIKSLGDAIRELGSEHPLVLEYETIINRCGGLSSDITAYMALRIIAAALNEGWEPQFDKKEHRYYPWFALWTEEELAKKSEEWKKENSLLFFAGASCGLACTSSNLAWSLSSSSLSARIAVKSKELAEYFGRQFIKIWADYLLIDHGCDEKKRIDF